MILCAFSYHIFNLFIVCGFSPQLQILFADISRYNYQSIKSTYVYYIKALI